jgi:hypothetical protein
MKLGKLSESFTNPDTFFLKLYQTEDLSNCTTLNETKETISTIFAAADTYAVNNKFKHKYFDLAHTPLWENLEIEKHHFILKGFDAFIAIDLTENLHDIRPFVLVQHNNVEDLEYGHRIEITEEFINSMVVFQKELFLEALHRFESETVETLKAVWKVEQQRIDKWVKTCKIDLNS